MECVENDVGQPTEVILRSISEHLRSMAMAVELHESQPNGLISKFRHGSAGVSLQQRVLAKLVGKVWNDFQNDFQSAQTTMENNSIPRGHEASYFII